MKKVHTVRMTSEQHKDLKERAFQAKTSLNQYTLDILFPPDAIELCKRGVITKEELMKRLDGLPSMNEFLNGRITFEALRQDYESQVRERSVSQSVEVG